MNLGPVLNMSLLRMQRNLRLWLTEARGVVVRGMSGNVAAAHRGGHREVRSAHTHNRGSPH
ncbi:hypothetical protein E2C01_083194 [Portunus trituberculatus]|uniref:Uncharacterized protein n=1 Tax=Portunus trituberculatus TaxID=210409 RepID=A0A5B7J1B3_PORTR|nr:hypothetical protein [Portunus trituberculatus]